MSGKEKTRAIREITANILSRPSKMCNFIEWQDKKVRLFSAEFDILLNVL